LCAAHLFVEFFRYERRPAAAIDANIARWHRRWLAGASEQQRAVEKAPAPADAHVEEREVARSEHVISPLEVFVDCLYRLEEFAFNAVEHSDCGLGANLHRRALTPLTKEMATLATSNSSAAAGVCRHQ
jgi:hypothetical protein